VGLQAEIRRTSAALVICHHRRS